MDTRATIEFRSGKEAIYIYRHSDGFPDTILSDINYTIEKKKDSWSDGGSFIYFGDYFS